MMPRLNRRISVAPMMDWTDRHCRVFHRQLTRHALLYTEMVTSGALLYGDVPRHLDFDPFEQPVALQLGGSEPDDLVQCARLGERWGYREINLNCGCPSERVQRGAFGACLMAEPQLVAHCVKAMQDAASIPVTVKHRIGIRTGRDQRQHEPEDDYGFVRDFVGRVAEAGCQTFIVHARSAWLDGLSPKENREIPPLRYDYAYQLKSDFPHLEIILNGGLKVRTQIDDVLTRLDGVMIGREAYHNPYWLAQVDQAWYDATLPIPTRLEIVFAMVEYADQQIAKGVPLRVIVRHMLGLYQFCPGARSWRRMLSDAKNLNGGDSSLLLRALQLVEDEVPEEFLTDIDGVELG